MSPVPRPEIVTLGCRLNIAESETIRGLVGARDVVVVNSCAVTNEAVKQTRRAIRRARRDRPTARLVVTGCAARIDPVGFAAMPEVDRVVANDDKLTPAAWADNATSSPAPGPVVAFAGHARAFIAVQTGCDHACTFCAIPAGRGPNQSVAIGAIVDRIAALVDAGHREAVLTGVDVASHGAGLGAVVEAVLTGVPALERLRLSSLDPAAIDDRLFALLTQEPRVMPHVHLSIQAGDDLILKRMRRRHSRAQLVSLVDRLKAARSDIAIGADLIAGFPTESEAAFKHTLALVDDCGLVHAHVFPYSPRDGTPAARMPQVAPAEVRARAARLRDAAATRKAAWLAGLVGSTQQVLVERPGDRGHAANFAEVRLPLPARTGRALIGVPPSPVRPEPVEGRLAANASPVASRASTGSARTEVGAVCSVVVTGASPTHLTGTPA